MRLLQCTYRTSLPSNSLNFSLALSTIPSSFASLPSMLLSDEEFARRLQDEENGLAGGARHTGGHQRTPTAENPTVINARLNDLNSSRSTLCLLFSVQTPQIIAAMVVLMIHWNDPDVCDHTHTEQWKWWGALAALRMLSYELIVLAMFLYKATLERNQEV